MTTKQLICVRTLSAGVVVLGVIAFNTIKNPSPGAPALPEIKRPTKVWVVAVSAEGVFPDAPTNSAYSVFEAVPDAPTNSAYESNDLETLAVAYALYQEARGESYAGKKAVASVIFNRTRTRGLSFSQVVFQPRQFAVDSKVDLIKVDLINWVAQSRAPADTEALSDCISIAYDVVHGLFTPLGRWTHFHSGDEPPDYFENAYEKQRIGGHWFYIVLGEY